MEIPKWNCTQRAVDEAHGLLWRPPVVRMAMDVKGITLKWYPVSATDGRIGVLGRASSDVEFGGGDCAIASSWLCAMPSPTSSFGAVWTE